MTSQQISAGPEELLVGGGRLAVIGALARGWVQAAASTITDDPKTVSAVRNAIFRAGENVNGALFGHPSGGDDAFGADAARRVISSQADENDIIYAGLNVAHRVLHQAAGQFDRGATIQGGPARGVVGLPLNLGPDPYGVGRAVFPSLLRGGREVGGHLHAASVLVSCRHETPTVSTLQTCHAALDLVGARVSGIHVVKSGRALRPRLAHRSWTWPGDPALNTQSPYRLPETWDERTLAIKFLEANFAPLIALGAGADRAVDPASMVLDDAFRATAELTTLHQLNGDLSNPSASAAADSLAKQGPADGPKGQ